MSEILAERNWKVEIGKVEIKQFLEMKRDAI